MKFCALLFLFFGFNLEAAPPPNLALVTGEYAPYSGEKLPEGGYSAKIVKAAFSEVNQPFSIEFIPWNRAMNYLKTNVAAGSFPWTKNSEREVDMLYSEPIHKYKLLSFVRKESSLLKKYDLEKKKVCQPSGWDLSFMDEAIAKYHVHVERPINMESCFRMLELGRVDLLVINEHVGLSMLAELFPKKSNIVTIDNDYYKSAYLYFIVSKTYPNASKIIADFNRGLQLIKSNGKYDVLMQPLSKKESIKSSCESCSRVGLL